LRKTKNRCMFRSQKSTPLTVTWGNFSGYSRRTQLRWSSSCNFLGSLGVMVDQVQEIRVCWLLACPRATSSIRMGHTPFTTPSSRERQFQGNVIHFSGTVHLPSNTFVISFLYFFHWFWNPKMRFTGPRKICIATDQTLAKIMVRNADPICMCAHWGKVLI
jgi:hypothetical protein